VRGSGENQRQGCSIRDFVEDSSVPASWGCGVQWGAVIADVVGWPWARVGVSLYGLGGDSMDEICHGTCCVLRRPGM